jgi:hypothetical protein
MPLVFERKAGFTDDIEKEIQKDDLENGSTTLHGVS